MNKLHFFNEDIKCESLPKTFTYPFCYTPHPLCIKAKGMVCNYLSTQTRWTHEIAQGKMFGILIVENQDQKVGFLAAFSGHLEDSNNHDYFVPSIFDFLQPEAYFKTEERHISLINQQIKSLEQDSKLTNLKHQLTAIKKQFEETLRCANEAYKVHKSERDALKTNKLTPDELNNLIRESQFEKAEIKRLKIKFNTEIEHISNEIRFYESNINTLKNERKIRSEALQKWLFEHYQPLNAHNETQSIYQIFRHAQKGLPPAGTGDCCAPKLLHYAYFHHLRPVAMAEFWLGESPKGEIRKSGQFYPACQNKCFPVLSFMLQGLDVEPNPLQTQQTIKIVYEDEAILLINKPFGILSTAGKVSDYSVQKFAKEHCGLETIFVVHRLDMSTSGLLLIAKNQSIYAHLQKQFAQHSIVKHYYAILDGIVTENSGSIDLPICPNPNDRPRQMVSEEYGKKAITQYEVLERKNNHTRVRFTPITGRTHQLRLHSAYEKGLNCPILGDSLYGNLAERLYLQAYYLEFTHPVNNKRMHFELEPEF